MNEATKAEVLAAVAKWRPRLRLNDWAVAFTWDAEVDDGKAMQTEVKTQYRRLTLLVSGDTTNDGWQTVEKQVLHELCHAITEEPNDIAVDLMNALDVGKLTFAALDTALRAASERATEWVASVMWAAYEGTPWDAEPPLTES